MDLLDQLANDIRETFDDRGHRIEQAISHDPAFRKNRKSQSSLGRDLFVDATELGSHRLGLNYRVVNGNASEVVLLVGDVYRYFRVRKAKWNADVDDFEVIGEESILTIEDAEEGLYGAERWILGYTATDDEMVEKIFVARVLGVSGESVSRLVLGPATLLGTAGATPPGGGGFSPPDEDDLGFDDDMDQDDEEGAADAV
ncbi:hypothetical protein [Williamsia muralis]|uniref:hypothetical protein n=1 Tax=Williamsia marianensis TaxID=85044 RepID=UPI000DE6B1A7|nr:hypothetical protein [Williamsia marianensis]PVY28357.1 hypothetical protein C7458_10826 [Williamsia marianensis]